MSARTGRVAFGDHVEYDIGDGGGGDRGSGYVLGVMAYALDGSVVLVGDAERIGMPITADHCTLVSSGHDEATRPWRERYLSQCSGTLVPLDPLEGLRIAAGLKQGEAFANKRTLADVKRNRP